MFLSRIVLLSLALLTILITHTTATYTLTHSFHPSTFFSAFTFFTAPDPTLGTVTFVDQHTAHTTNLTSTTADSVYIGVDSTVVIQGSNQGRASVRLESKAAFNKGLLIADVLHMPGGICGTWPALWMVGPEWPAGGEIDILEGVNAQVGNLMSLHTGKDCAVVNSTGSSSAEEMFSGEVLHGNCAVDGFENVGCSIGAPEVSTSSLSPTYGTAFNDAGGAVMAMQWTSTAISIWILPRNAVDSTYPSTVNALSASPDPSLWGTPIARFSSRGCDIDRHFKDMKIAIDTTFCGVWAGKVWQSGGCAERTGVQTCEEFVRGRPEAFEEAFWRFGGLWWFEEGQQHGGQNATGLQRNATRVTGPPLRQYGNGSLAAWSWRNGTMVLDAAEHAEGTLIANSTGSQPRHGLHRRKDTRPLHPLATACHHGHANCSVNHHPAHGTEAAHPHGTDTPRAAAFQVRKPPAPKYIPLTQHSGVASPHNIFATLSHAISSFISGGDPSEAAAHNTLTTIIGMGALLLLLIWEGDPFFEVLLLVDATLRVFAGPPTVIVGETVLVIALVAKAVEWLLGLFERFGGGIRVL